LSHARGSPAREVQRAQILCRFEAGETITQIARALKTSRPSVRKWVDKALAMGASAALKDTWHRPHAPVITEEAKAWVVHLACSKPKEHGLAAELWTRSSPALYVRQHAQQTGHPSLTKAVKATVHRILAAQEPHPERVQYYLEKRDPEFETKMKDILLVYQEVALQNERQADSEIARIITVSASSLFQWMRNRVCRPSPIPLRICLPLPVNIPLPVAITNTSGWALARSWRRWTCTTVM